MSTRLQSKTKHINKKARNFLKDGLSINEAKTSTLIITYIPTMLVLVYMAYKNNDINTLAKVAMTLIGGISSINILGQTPSSDDDISYDSISYDDTQFKG